MRTRPRLAEYQAEVERADLRADGAMTYQVFHRHKPRMCACPEKAAGSLAEAYAIQAIDGGHPARYGLAIDRERITIIDGSYV